MCGVAMVRMSWKTRERQCHANDQPSPIDLLGLEKHVRAASKHLTAPNREPPLRLSMEAEWGGGKSSLMKQLREEIRRQKPGTSPSRSTRGDRPEYVDGDDDSGLDYNAKIITRPQRDREYVVRPRLYYASAQGSGAIMLY